MTTTIDAVVAHVAGDLRLDTTELAEALPHEAIVAIRYGGICGSDLHYWKQGYVGESVLSEPLILGHEVVGIVAEAASDGSGPSAGTPVFVHPAIVCGHCDFCLSGRQHLCSALRYMGSAARKPHTPGGFASHVVVPTARLVPLPAELELTTAALIEPASVAWHAVARFAALGFDVVGKSVAVIGAGPIGLLVVATLRKAGARTIVVSDVFERPLAIATDIGATAIVTARDAQEYFAANPVDAIVESSGTAPGLRAALLSSQPSGVIVAVGQLPNGGVDSPLHLLIGREITLTGSSRFYSEYQPVIDALSDGSLATAGIVSHVFAASDNLEAFTVAADSGVSSKVLLEFGDDSR